MARPSNAQKSSPAAIRENASLLLGEALIKLRNRIRTSDFQDKSLIDLVGKLLPLVADENTQTEADVTMDVLARKAVQVNLRIQQANEQNMRQEVIEDVVGIPETTEEDSVE